MNVSFTQKQEQYIAAQIASGDYQNASELIRDALRLHEIYRHKVIQDLRVEISKGWDGPDSSKTVQEIIKEKQVR
jgi:antitoxin ParD1/3/4